MDNNTLLSKISASPQDNAWSQAYSTLNLYIVMSIKTDEESELVNQGKELFEKIQREYFSLDEKNLKNIKSSVESAIGEFAPDKKISIVLATLKDNILYIVTAGAAEAVIKRGSKIGTIAKGEEGQVIAFSGEVKNDDIIVLETDDFTKKVSLDRLSHAFSENDPSAITESITPIIHEESIGTEAALVLEYKGEVQKEEIPAATPETEDHDTSPVQDLKEAEEKEETEETEQAQEDNIPQESTPKERKLPKIPFSIASFKNIGRKKLIIIAIFVLVGVLVGSILLEKGRQENAKLNEALTEVLNPAQKNFDEATSLLGLDKGLALEEFQKIKSTLDSKRPDFKEGSEQLKKLNEFIGKVESEIGKLTEGSAVTNEKMLFDNVKYVTYKESSLIAIDEKGVINLLDSNGKSSKEFKTENDNPVAITASESSIYILGDAGITRTTIASGDTADAVEDPGDSATIDLFGTNVYSLNTGTKSIDRYSGASYAKGDYLDEDVTLDKPASMAIDGSIWVIDDGKIRKFTRGGEDSFNVSGLSDLSNSSFIFTSIDYDNLYVIDKKAAKIYVISKDGEIESQYTWTGASKADSIAADEENNKIYVTSDNKLYSIEF